MEVITIIEMNKSIALYIGFVYKSHQEAKDKKFAGWQSKNVDSAFLNKKQEGSFVSYGWLCRNNNNLRFHESWEWLMGAYEKALSNHIIYSQEDETVLSELKIKFSSFVSEANIKDAHKTLYEITKMLSL